MKVNQEILKKESLIIAFDTSCDDTSVSVLKGRKVLSSVVSSQVEIHAEFGGVVPDVARREHEKNIQRIYEEALKKAKTKIEDVEYISATYGPGLAIDLEIGLKFAQDLAIKYDKPFIPVNHMEGHLLSGLLLNSKGNGLVTNEKLENIFPSLGLLISGKHTEIIYIEELGKYKKLGQTLDDAVGEAFDKVGRMLNFGYPGGPVVSEFAKKGTSGIIDLPIPMKGSGDLNFSYSGLKTAALYKTKQLREQGLPDKEWVYDFCRAFLDAVIESLNLKLRKAIEENIQIKSVFIGGGVVNSEEILRRIGNLVRSYELDYIYPEKEYRGDNAAMIGLAAYFKSLRGEYLQSKEEISLVDRDPRLSIEENPLK
jgi:N6-L-threonylcarbamoyladenine synthase